MSYHDYQEGKEIVCQDFGFYGIIQAAMRRGDDSNVQLLKSSWPEVWKDLQARYRAMGGYLIGEAPDGFSAVSEEDAHYYNRSVEHGEAEKV